MIDTLHVTSHLVHGSAPLPASADGGGVGGELSRVVNLSVVLQGRDAGSVDVHDRVQGAVVPRLLWQSDIGLPGESQREVEGDTAGQRQRVITRTGALKDVDTCHHHPPLKCRMGVKWVYFYHQAERAVVWH